MAGESARDEARASRERAERLLANAEKWERGAAGEARTAEVLGGLGQEWVVWHDLTWPGRRYANLDHLVIGPTGIFVIDSKNWSGSITVRDGVLRQNGYRREQEVAACGEAALAVGALMPEFMAVCEPVICFVRHEKVHVTARGVVLTSSTTLVEVLVARPRVLNDFQIAQIASTLRALMTTKAPAIPSPRVHHTPSPSPRTHHVPSSPASRRVVSQPKRSWRTRAIVVAKRVLVFYVLMVVLGGLAAIVKEVADSPSTPAPAVSTDTPTSSLGQ